MEDWLDWEEGYEVARKAIKASHSVEAAYFPGLFFDHLDFPRVIGPFYRAMYAVSTRMAYSRGDRLLSYPVGWKVMKEAE